MSQLYHGPHKGVADYRGYPAMVHYELFEQLGGLYRQHEHVALHGSGDASIEDTLDDVWAASAKCRCPETKPVIFHTQMTRKDQNDRLAPQGVSPSFFSSRTFFWSDRHASIFTDPERVVNMGLANWALNAGARLPSYVDTRVTRMRPAKAVRNPVQRKMKTGVVLKSDQRIDPMSVLRAITIDAAWQAYG